MDIKAGKNPGELVIPSLGKTIKLVEWREDDFYDAVQAVNAPTQGLSLEFFRDLSNKYLQHTNLRTPRRIPAGSELIISRMGVYIPQAVGSVLPTDADVILFAHAASLTFKLNDRLITEGPLFKYQSGYGIVGSTTRTGTGIATTGVASAAAAPQLFVAQTVQDDDDLQATADFKNNSWLSGGTSMPTFSTQNAVATLPLAQLFLHGIVKKPQGK